MRTYLLLLVLLSSCTTTSRAPLFIKIDFTSGMQNEFIGSYPAHKWDNFSQFKKIARHLAYIVDNDHRILGCGTAMDDKSIVTVAHFGFSKNEMKIVVQGKSYDIKHVDDRWKEFDVQILYTSKSIQGISKKMQLSSLLENKPLYVSYPGIDNSAAFQQVKTVSIQNIYEIDYKYPLGVLVLGRSQKGYSGSPLFVIDNGIPKIVGICSSTGHYKFEEVSLYINLLTIIGEKY